MFQLLTNLFPAWILFSAVSAYLCPEMYLWFDKKFTTPALVGIMLAPGLSLTLKDFANVFTKQPQLLALGMVLQYTVLPAVGYLISR